MNLAIKILICDDSEEFAFWFYKKIDKLLHKDNFVCSFDIIVNPQDVFKSKQIYDLVFLDIDMPEISGFQLCQYLYQRNKQTKIIFVSGKDVFIYKAIEYQPLDFIRKLYIEDELEVKAARWISKLKPKTYCIIMNKQKILININDILFVQKFGNYSLINTVDKEWKERKKITVCLEELNKIQNTFIMIHRSIIVNMANVMNLKNNKFLLINGQEMSIAKQRLNQVVSQYNVFRIEREVL